MLDLTRGPLLVGVADRAEALIRAAELDLDARLVDVIEARVDLFEGQTLEGRAGGADACARLEASGTPVLVTVRTVAQGGRFGGDERTRLRRFEVALQVASWADVEDDAAILGDVATLVAARPGGQLLVSHHDFGSTPPLDRLLAVVDRAHETGGAIAKVATAVKTANDRQTLLELVARRPRRTCVIGMSASEDLRFELVARGSLLAYGYLAGPTAPGQLSAAETHARLLSASDRYAERRRLRGTGAVKAPV
jgi:3-dehydroquinate dehydratase I